MTAPNKSQYGQFYCDEQEIINQGKEPEQLYISNTSEVKSYNNYEPFDPDSKNFESWDAAYSFADRWAYILSVAVCIAVLLYLAWEGI